jgi:hypothetical protein
MQEPVARPQNLGPKGQKLTDILTIGSRMSGVGRTNYFPTATRALHHEFQNPQTEYIAIPMGDWGGKVGQQHLSKYVTQVWSFSTVLMMLKATTIEDFEPIMTGFQEECKRGEAHFDFYVVRGDVPTPNSILSFMRKKTPSGRFTK